MHPKTGIHILYISEEYQENIKLYNEACSAALPTNVRANVFLQHINADIPGKFVGFLQCISL